MIKKNLQYYKFCLYGFFKNLRFFDAFLILFFLEKGLDFIQIGTLYAVREMAILVLEIPSGVLADALGRRRTLIAAFFVYILSFVLFYFSTGYLLLIAAMLLFAFGDAFRTGVHKAMIFQYLKVQGREEQKTSYYGHTRSWSQMGSAISALVAGLIVFFTESYRDIFLVSTIPYFIGMSLIASYPKYLEGERKIFSAHLVSSRFSQVLHAFLLTLKQIVFLRTLTNLSLYTGYYRAVKDYIQLLLKYFALGIPAFAWLNDDKKIAVMVGVFYFFIYGLTSVASRNSGNFMKLFRGPGTAMNRSLLIGLTAGIITGLTFFVHFYVLAILGFLVVVIVENLRKPIGIALIADLTEDGAMATALSAQSQIKSLFAAIVSLLLGWLADIYGPGMAILAITAFLILLFPLYRLKK
ncbi:MAG: MFS transporter [Bacteroidales bacterium]|nr:MFS transporter [Bacteroidales bacterium]MCF6342912.1 MFS transporter [Bacteroidales bacterium]